MGMFWVQTRVIRVCFSTLPSPVVFGPEKVAKIRLNLFSAVLTKNDKYCTQTVRVCFGCKT